MVDFHLFEVLREEWMELLSILRDIYPNMAELDKVVWWRNVDGFSVKNNFERLYELKSHNSAVSDRCLLELDEV